jgi:hypothetical protein
MNFREYLDLSVIGLPTVTRQSKIIGVKHTTNRAIVHLEDGTVLNLKRHEIESIKNGKELLHIGEHSPVGKMMKMVVQRHPKDKSNLGSQIQWAEVL